MPCFTSALPPSPQAPAAAAKRRAAAPRFFASVALAAATVLAAAPVHAAPTLQVTIQAWQVCDDFGNNCASTSYFDAFTQKIWAQADITVNFLAMQQVNSTSRLNEDDFTELGNVGDASVIDLWFINDLSDCGGFYGFNSLYGCGGTGGWFAMTQAVFDFSAIGRVDTLSHELGHVLGLGHNNFGAGGVDNLMTSGGDGRQVAQALGDVNPDGLGLEKLTDEQIAQARSSGYTSRVLPEPGSLALAALALLGAGLARRNTAARALP